jgi:hypothetical protein
MIHWRLARYRTYRPRPRLDRLESEELWFK